MSGSEISDFSRRFSAALQGVMRENKVTIEAIANHMPRSKGFVSNHTSGKSAPDTDLIDAVAELIGIPTKELIVEIARRLRDEESGGNVSALPVRPVLDDLGAVASTENAVEPGDLE